ncbi:MAG: phosphoribosylanthranilate isomerase [Rhizobiaceae bacterium]
MTQAMKICGLSTPQSVDAALRGGATHLGFIFFAKSPRNVSPDQAAPLAARSKSAKTVAVSVNADDEFLEHIVTAMKPDMLQLHGSETPQRIDELKARYGLPIIKAVSIRAAADLEKLPAYAQCADMLLLDAKPPAGSDLPGGNGVSFDWSLIDDLHGQVPILLSGGIDFSNIEEAIALVRDPSNGITGLDLSSGVESAPGVKDIAKIDKILAAVRAVPAT